MTIRPETRRRLARAASPLVAALLLAAPPPAAAQTGAAQTGGETPVVELPETVVTATRLPTPLEQVASSVTVITAAEIARRQYRTLPEALRLVPGLDVVQSGPTGAITSVFMRGTESNHTLVLIDGIEINDPSTPDGAFDFSNMPLADVARIEVEPVVREPAKLPEPGEAERYMADVRVSRQRFEEIAVQLNDAVIRCNCFVPQFQAVISFC